MRRIGVLMGYPENDLEGPAFSAVFREGLQKLGWMEDRNVRLDTRWASPDDAEARRRYESSWSIPYDNRPPSSVKVRRG